MIWQTHSGILVPWMSRVVQPFLISFDPLIHIHIKHAFHHDLRLSHMLYWLMVWNINFIFPYIGNVIIPSDELILFRGVGIPPTRLINSELKNIKMFKPLNINIKMVTSVIRPLITFWINDALGCPWLMIFQWQVPLHRLPIGRGQSGWANCSLQWLETIREWLSKQGKTSCRTWTKI